MTTPIRRFTFAFALLALIAAAPARADVLVNIDARHYGYQESATIPNIGQAVTPISEAPGGGFNQLILTAGIYEITNAAGQFGALFDAFKFNQATGGETWTWNFLLVNASAGNKAILFGNGAGLSATEDGAAAGAAGYSGFFALTGNAVLNFMIRDNSLGDNTGGVSLRIRQVAPLNVAAVPEPAALAMLALGALLPAAALARRRGRVA